MAEARLQPVQEPTMDAGSMPANALQACPPPDDGTAQAPRGTVESLRDLEGLDELDIGDLILLPRFQMRSKLNEATIRRYATAIRQGAEFPPIKVALINGAPHVVDGFHRVEAHQEAGKGTIRAEVVVTTPREALAMAARANTTHGERLRPKELQKAFKALIAAKQHRKKGGGFRSYRDLAADLGGQVSHNTIRNWMQKFFPRIALAMGKGEAPHDVQEEPLYDPEEEAARRVWEALRDAVAASRAVKRPALRGEIVRAAQDALREIEDALPWIEVRREF